MSDIPAHVVQAVAWTLVHSLWQFGLACGVSAILFRSLRQVSATIQYRTQCIVMLTATLATIATCAALLSSSPSAMRLTITNGLIDLLHIGQPNGFRDVLDRSVGLLSPWIVSGWASYAIWRAGSMVCGWRQMQRLRARTTPTVPPDCWSRLVDRLGISPAVRMVATADFGGPFTTGWWRPVVVMPVSILAGMSPSQIEAILAHELAHIHRRDYLVCVLQIYLDGVLWFNPGARAISRRIYDLREKCADEVALSVVLQTPASYSRSILSLLDHPGPELLIGAKSSPLGDRFVHLLTPRRRFTAIAAMQAIALCVCLCASLGMVGKEITVDAAGHLAADKFTDAPLYVQVYDMLGATRENDELVPAVERAIMLLSTDRFDFDAACQLAAVVSRGGRSDALLQKSLQVSLAKALTPIADDMWSSRGRDWDRLAWQMREYATTSSNGSESVVLARASLMLSVQEKVVPNGFAYRMVRDPAFLRLLGMDTSQQSALFSAASSEAGSIAAGSFDIARWSSGHPETLDGLKVNPFGQWACFQWKVAKYIESVRQHDKARADSLIRSARASRTMQFCVLLLPFKG